MRTYIEAIETGVEEGEFHQEESNDSEQATLNSTLATINAALNNQKTYTKRVHYCMHEHNQPCVVEEIVNDTITRNKLPNIEISN